MLWLTPFQHVGSNSPLVGSGIVMVQVGKWPNWEKKNSLNYENLIKCTSCNFKMYNTIFVKRMFSYGSNKYCTV